MTIQKFLKTAMMVLIPGMFLRRLHKIGHDLNTGGPQKRRRIAIELGVATLCLIGGAALGGFIGFAILIPVLEAVSQGTMLATLILSVFSVGLISLELGFLSTKHSLRFLSWLKHHNDSNVVNPTNLEKYSAKHFKYSDTSNTFEKEQTEAQNAMRRLYLEKQKIKNKPEGCFGELSAKQQEKRNAINYAVKVLQRGSVTSLFQPISSFQRNTTPEASLDQYHFQSKGITSEQQTFLKGVIPWPEPVIDQPPLALARYI